MAFCKEILIFNLKMNIFIFTLVLMSRKQGKMKRIALLNTLLIGILLAGNICFAETTNNIYIINNVTQPSYAQGSNVMCSRNGALCTNGYFMMSTAGARYLAPQWKRQTLREKRMQEETVRAAAKINY